MYSLGMMAFTLLACQLYALPEGRPFMRHALAALLGETFTGIRGRFLAYVLKSICLIYFLNAFSAAGHLRPLDVELKALRRNRRLTKALLMLIDAWSGGGSLADSASSASTLRIASQGGLLGAFVIRGTLVNELVRDHDLAGRLAMELAEAGTAESEWQGLTAVGYLLAAAVTSGLAEREPVWFEALRERLRLSASRVWSRSGPPTIIVDGVTCCVFDLQHLLLSYAADAGGMDTLLASMTDALPEGGSKRPRADSIERQRLIIRALGVLTRFGYATAGIRALEAWRDETDPTLLGEAGEVLSELLAAHPSHVEGWLEGTRNARLESLVQERLLGIGPERLIFNYGVYSFLAVANNAAAAASVAPRLAKALTDARRLEDALRIVGDLLFDPEKTPFRYA